MEDHREKVPQEGIMIEEANIEHEHRRKENIPTENERQ